MSIQREGFSRDMSLMLKGVGILMMIWHHCFMKYSLFDDYYTRLCFLTVSQGSHIAEFCKICVTMFAFVSGYGLYQAYKQKSSKENASRWIVRRYIKGFAPFWFVYMLSLIAYALYNGKPVTLYFKDNISKRNILCYP